MVWLLKHLQPPARHEHPELRRFHVPSLCHLRCCSSLRSCYLRPYREDILIRHCSVLCKLLIGNPLRHLCCGGVPRNVKPPCIRFLQASNIKCEEVWCSPRFLKRDSKGLMLRRVAVFVKRGGEGAYGRDARSSRLESRSSCVDHLQNCRVKNARSMYLTTMLFFHDLLSSTAHNKNPSHGSAETS